MVSCKGAAVAAEIRPIICIYVIVCITQEWLHATASAMLCGFKTKNFGARSFTSSHFLGGQTLGMKSCLPCVKRWLFAATS